MSDTKRPWLPPPVVRRSETSTHTPYNPVVRAARPPAPLPGQGAVSPSCDFSVWVVAYNEQHRATFAQVARSLVASLRKLGYSVEETCGAMPSGRGGQTIVFGTNILRNHALVPADAIVYQLEQPGSHWMNEAYLRLLRAHIVWDFSPGNVDKLRARGVTRIHLCRVGASPEGRGKIERTKDIDVLFYGSPNPRRKLVLDQLRSRGLVVHDGPAWGEHLDELIDRAKTVLNIHYYPDAVLEMVRLAPAIERGAFVISETGADQRLEEALDGGIVLSSYGAIASTVFSWLQSSQADRNAVAARGAAALRRLPHRDEIARCIAESIPRMRRQPIKCFINNRDRLTWTRNMVREIERLGGEPVIVDNASSYPPLLAWYELGCPCRVIRLAENGGSRAPWLSGVIARELSDGDLYVVTDPDLDLSRVPADALQVLARGLDRYGRHKAGLSLEINDVPRRLLDVVQENRLTLGQIESRYWQKRLDAEFYDAAVDTTFALYRYSAKTSGGLASDPMFCSGVRSDRPYVARHLPWYRAAQDFDEEDRYYIAHRRLVTIKGTITSGTWYDSVRKAAP